MSANTGKDLEKLNDRHELFCIEYMKDLNGGQAIKRAKFKPKNMDVAYTMAYELLQKPKIIARLEELKKEYLEDVKESLEIKFVKGLTKIIDVDLRSEMKYKKPTVYAKDQLKALELYGKYGTMFKDKIVHSTVDKDGNEIGINSNVTLNIISVPDRPIESIVIEDLEDIETNESRD